MKFSCLILFVSVAFFCRNKVAIVKIGAAHKILKLIESPCVVDSSVYEAIVENFLGLSALDSNKPTMNYLKKPA